ncbi:hypothetical protein D3C73_1642860 [compost metagenome]
MKLEFLLSPDGFVDLRNIVPDDIEPSIGFLEDILFGNFVVFHYNFMLWRVAIISIAW